MEPRPFRCPRMMRPCEESDARQASLGQWLRGGAAERRGWRAAQGDEASGRGAAEGQARLYAPW